MMEFKYQGWLMKRPKHSSLKAQYTPKSRKSMIDYDYIKKLNEEELDFLSKFTSENYGADLDINTTYIKENDEYIQISNNEDPKNNRDLRKYRKVTKYYKNDKGEFTQSKKFKYSKNNLHNTNELRKSCNENANANGRDIMAIGQIADFNKDEFNFFLENLQEGSSPEDLMILEEILRERQREEDK